MHFFGSPTGSAMNAVTRFSVSLGRRWTCKSAALVLSHIEFVGALQKSI